MSAQYRWFLFDLKKRKEMIPHRKERVRKNIYKTERHRIRRLVDNLEFF